MSEQPRTPVKEEEPSQSAPATASELQKRKYAERPLRERAADRWLRCDESVSDAQLEMFMSESKTSFVTDGDLEYDRGTHYWKSIKRYYGVTSR